MPILTEDLVYQSPNGKDLHACLYRPEGPGPFPAVLEVHGGAWTSGDRFNNVTIAEALAADGVVVLSIDFRMPPDAPYPAASQDVNLGIRFLKANATKFGSRPDLVGGLGTSSGGHLLLLSALRPNDARYTTLPLPGSDVDASLAFAIACWPVADPLKRYRTVQANGNDRLVAAHDAFWPSVEDMTDGNPTLILQRGESVAKPPVLIIQGTNDNNLTPDMAGGFAMAYAAAGGKVTFESFPEQPHAFIPNAPAAPASVQALHLIRAFVHRNTI
ncbi:MAG TPA: alpha/beta hydrolase [Acetobacteraceae bacterium]|jgi:acetyl esterase|nr:alpha/beta hydrolase [Acetobacteraceae bacterium]